jgi:hypothetical protein
VGSIAQGTDGRFDDVLRGWKIGLANAQIDDVAPFIGQFSRAAQDAKGILFANAREGRVHKE